jgi:hypothetical protein
VQAEVGGDPSGSHAGAERGDAAEPQGVRYLNEHKRALCPSMPNARLWKLDRQQLIQHLSLEISAPKGEHQLWLIRSGGWKNMWMCS